MAVLPQPLNEWEEILEGTSTYGKLTQLAKQSGIESSLIKGEVAPDAGVRALLDLFILTTPIRLGSFEASFVRAATQHYVSSKTILRSRTALPPTYATRQLWESWASDKRTYVLERGSGGSVDAEA